MLKITNLAFDSFLRDNNLHVKSGDIVALVGCKNAGHDDMLSHIYHYSQPTRGCIELLGKRYLDFTATEIKATIGRVFNKPTLYPRLTVRENLAFFARLYGSRLSDVQKVMEKATLAEYHNHQVGRLSLGLKRRVDISRVLLGSPVFLFISEPFLDLDSQSIYIIQELLSQWAGNEKAIIMSTYGHPGVLDFSTQVVYMEEGTILPNTGQQNPDDKSVLDSETLNVQNIQKIPVKVDDCLILLSPDDILYMSKSLEKVEVVTQDGRTYSVGYSLTELESKLESLGFFRCHRSYIVNICYIHEVMSWSRNSYELVLTDKTTRVPLSKHRLAALTKRIGW